MVYYKSDYDANYRKKKILVSNATDLNVVSVSIVLETGLVLLLGWRHQD